MKKLSFLLFALLLCALTAKAYDYRKAGFKGEVSTAQCQLNYSKYNTQFGFDGFLEAIALETTEGIIEVKDVNETPNGFYGYLNGNRVDITVSQGRISKATYNDGNSSYVLTYTYNTEGFLSKVTQVETWYEDVEVVRSASVRVNTREYENYMRKAREALARGNMIDYNKYLALAARAAGNASVEYNPGSVNTRRERRTSTTTASFYNYNTDKYGNWTSRTKEGNTESQAITYNSRFLSKRQWEDDILPSGDLEKIEKFAKSETTYIDYKTIAEKEWNRLFVETVKNGLDETQSLYYASKDIISPENREVLYAPLRNSIFYDQVSKENNFERIDAIVANYDKYNGLIDSNLRNRIAFRRNKLRDEYIESQLSLGKDAMDNNRYGDAHDNAIEALRVDPNNLVAKHLFTESHYKMVKMKEAIKTVRDNDYEDFLTMNPGSTHDQEMKNNRAQLAISGFDKYTSISEMQHVLTYGADNTINQSIRKTIEKKEKKIRHDIEAEERGGLFYAGVSGTLSGCNTLYSSAGLGLKFGCTKQWINLYVGGEYQNAQYSHFLSTFFDTDEKKSQHEVDDTLSRFEAKRFVIPVDLRINLTRSNSISFYVYGGVQYNIPFKGRYRTGNTDNTYKWNDDKKIIKKNSITPRFGFGVNISHIELEFNGYLENNNLYDKAYIEKLFELHPEMNTNRAIKQMKTNFHAGVTLRFLFGKTPNNYLDD